MNINSSIGKKIHNIFIEFIKFMIGTLDGNKSKPKKERVNY